MNDTYNYDSNELTKWFYAKNATGVALLCHGLNDKPSVMNPLAEFLNSINIDVLRISLSGHRGNLKELKEITLKDWEKDILDAYKRAMERSKEKNLPLFWCGFSLGGLLGKYLTSNLIKSHQIKKFILLSPALAIHWFFKPVPFVFKLGGGRIAGGIGRIMIPSKNPEIYRTQNGSSIASYNAVFESLSKLKWDTIKKENNPSLILIDPRDEMISLSGIKEKIKKYHLKNWKIETIDTDYTQLDITYHHLIFDSLALGEREWQKMKEIITNFLHLHLE